MIWFGWVLWHINLYRLLNAKSSLYIYIKYKYDLKTRFVYNIIVRAGEFFVLTVRYFQELLYNGHNLTLIICLHTVCSIWFINMILSDATTPGKSGPGSNGNEGVLQIPQISRFPKSRNQMVQCHIQGHSLEGLTTLQRCSRCILQCPLTDWAGCKCIVNH